MSDYDNEQDMGDTDNRAQLAEALRRDRIEARLAERKSKMAAIVADLRAAGFWGVPSEQSTPHPVEDVKGWLVLSFSPIQARKLLAMRQEGVL